MSSAARECRGCIQCLTGRCADAMRGRVSTPGTAVAGVARTFGFGVVDVAVAGVGVAGLGETPADATGLARLENM